MKSLVLKPPLDTLSDDARAVGAAWFGMGAGKSELIFRMRQGRPTARAQAGLDELVAAKIISREDNFEGGAVRYRALVDCGPLLAWAMKRIKNSELSFKLTETIG